MGAGDRRTQCARFRMEREGFVRATVDENSVLDLADAREGVMAAWHVAHEQRRPILVDLRGIRAQSRAARDYFVTAEVAERIRAVALLVDSPLSRMVGNFFVRKGNHPIPTRLFTDEAEAELWLMELPE